MVSKRKQKKSPKKSVHNEDIYLNDLQVEIKQEEELIIEDADQQYVQWRFIGLEDDVNEESVDWEAEEFQQLSFQNSVQEGNIQNQNGSFEEVIEISDEEINDSYEEKVDEAAMGEISCEVLITNEPLHDSLIEDRDKRSESPGNIKAKNEVTDACEDKFIEGNAAATSGKFKDNKKRSRNKRDITEKDGIDLNHGQDISNVDCLNVGLMHEWMCRKLIKMVCHVCGTTFQHNSYSWLSHMKQLHPKYLPAILSKYRPHSDVVVICKICDMQVSPKLNHTFHYITRHMEPKPSIFSCTICNYTDFSFSNLRKHQLQNHSSDITKRETCPKCGELFKDDATLDFHFMSVHIREFNAKFVYKCYLCDNASFESSKNKLFAHLIDKHKLANWKSLNFRKIENGAYLCCLKCFKIFVKTNVQQLLGHYLTHEEKSKWSCKFCKSSNHFKDWPVPHLCQTMRKFYEEKCKSSDALHERESNEENIHEQQNLRSVSWNEFEDCIEHVCPFCNEGFYKFEEWRMHVRELHHINTLKGLNMTIIANETDKFLCLECNAHVTKSAIELHKHRFQHLPYVPYKCRHCAKCLPTYDNALSHVRYGCPDNDKKCVKLLTSIRSNASPSETVNQQEAGALITISCALCNNRKFPEVAQLSKHITNVHDNFDKYFTKAPKDGSRSCKICQSDMKRNKSSEMISHYLQHLNERPYKCQKCSRSYSSYKNATRHVRVYHFNDTVMDTRECTQNIRIKQEEDTKPTPSVKSLIIVKTPIKNLQENDANEDILESRELHVVEYNHPVFKTYEKYMAFACPECNEQFSSRLKWELHVTSMHTFHKGNGLHIAEDETGRRKCLDCSVVVPMSLSKQQNHRLLHMPYRAFICALCLTHISAVASLYKHFRSHHFSDGIYKCALCPKTLYTDFKRLEHVKEVHPRTEWPNNMCTTCFKIVDDMDGHLLNNHLSHHRTHRCEKCDIFFERSRDLESHDKRMHPSINTQVNNGSIPDAARTVSRLGKKKLDSPSPNGHKNAKRICPSSRIPTRSGK